MKKINIFTSISFTSLGYYISNRLNGDIRYQHPFIKNNNAINRKNIIEKLGIQNKQLFMLNQKHTNIIQIVKKNHIEIFNENRDFNLNKADGMVTDQNRAILMIQSADCPLVLFFDPFKKILGVAHSGWKGTFSRINASMIKRMQDTYGSNPEDVIVGISPSAKACCYDVDTTLANQFSTAFSSKCLQKRDQHIFLDLPAAIAHDLIEAGVLPVHIEVIDTCTICSHDYFSYRREKEKAGRFGLFAWLN